MDRCRELLAILGVLTGLMTSADVLGTHSVRLGSLVSANPAGAAVMRTVGSWSFDGADAAPVELKGAAIVSDKAHGGCLKLPSSGARAVARVSWLPDPKNAKGAYTVALRIRPDKGIVPSAYVAMAGMTNSRRMNKFISALTDGEWHHLALVFDPARKGKEYTFYLDWPDEKSVNRFTSDYPKDGKSSGLTLPFSVSKSQVSFGGSVGLSMMSLGYTGLIDDIRFFDSALGAEEVKNL